MFTRREDREDRKGGILIFAAISMMLLLTFCLFSIDIAYIQLVRTELRTATDAASNAGCEALARNQSKEAAVEAAIAFASFNTVGGQPLVLTPDDVDLGTAAFDSSTGMYGFNGTVNGSEIVSSPTPLPEGSPTARAEFAINLNPAIAPLGGGGFGSFGKGKKGGFKWNKSAGKTKKTGTGTGGTGGGTVGGTGGTSGGTGGTGGGTNPTPTGTEPVVEMDPDEEEDNINSVRVSADRGDIRALSGGLFMSGTFKPTQQATSTNTVRDVALVLDRSGSMKQNEQGQYGHPQADWKMTDLKASVASFLDILGDAPTEIRCSLSSYSASGTKDVDMTANLASVLTDVNSMSPGGNTAVGQGLRHATDSLLYDVESRPYSTKAIVLMTDGMHNSGVHPDTVTPDCIARGHVVYTITFGANNSSSMNNAHLMMQKIADDTGGTHYPVATGAQLQEAFEKIANAMAVVLVQ